jgi:hypothetical protein
MFRYTGIGLLLMKYCSKVDTTQLEILPWICRRKQNKAYKLRSPEAAG